MDDAFRDQMQAGYGFEGDALTLGRPMQGTEVSTDAAVRLPLAMTNRHGLIAGATGTGKTKTLQVLAAQLSEFGVPVFISDIKGDVTGMAAPGDPNDPRVKERVDALALPFAAKASPVEFLSLSGERGAQVRATVHSFGPVLLSKVLDLNETQTAVLTLVFRYCDDADLPLLDLADLRTALRFLGSDEGKPILEEYGGMSTATVGVLLRSIVTLEESGAERFFGEPEFEVTDLMRTAPDGRGIVSILELSDVMHQPRLFSTFMLWMLAQLYETLPEMGDLPKPKLCFFFDEAHLLFEDASEALMDQIELTVRLIRSKGVGVYFVTQSPTDVPSSVLAQLGNRVQHALRAFTPEDADNLRKTARTFPMSDFYDVEQAITSLGIGEALVTVLSPRGIPTPLAATRLVPPPMAMGALDATLFTAHANGGSLRGKYGTPVDRESAHEMITARLASAKQAAAAAGETAAPASAAPGAMTQAQYEAAIEREAKARAKEIERERKAAEREWKAAERERKVEERARQRSIDSAIRTGGRVLTSRTGQSVLRSVFGTLFGGRR
jgi:DNA helicase HerA-like ATPase